MKTFLTLLTLLIASTMMGQCVPFTVSHSTNSVVPIDKVVNYQVVKINDLCWLAQNLGADKQAVAKNDASEESAGWYWQFNRKQGYKHAVTRTPYSEWIQMIPENSDWVKANDPCSILGEGWRIPTYSELKSVDKWTNVTSAYASELRLHLSGYLNTLGLLNFRGYSGGIWSSTQLTGAGAYLMILPNAVSMSASLKPMGWGIRCVND